MAKYSVTYTCGHTDTVSLYGKMTDRERKLAWLAEQECPECQSKKRAAANAAENEVAAKKAAEMGLPELTGTPKQVAWATTIRNKAVEIINEAANKPGAKANIITAALAAWVNDKTDASYWIDNKTDANSTVPCLKLMWPYIQAIQDSEKETQTEPEEVTEVDTDDNQRIKVIADFLHKEPVHVDRGDYKQAYAVGLSYETYTKFIDNFCNSQDYLPVYSIPCGAFRRPVGSDVSWEYCGYIGDRGYVPTNISDIFESIYYILGRDTLRGREITDEFYRVMGFESPLPHASAELEQFLSVLNEDEYLICEKLPDNRVGKVLAKGNKSGFVFDGYEYTLGINIGDYMDCLYYYVTLPFITRLVTQLKNRRKELGLSQVELAAQSGLTQNHIARIESGQHNVNIETLEKVCKALKLNISIQVQS